MRMLLRFTLAFVLAALALTAAAEGASRAARQAEVRQMADRTLEDLYEVQPHARKVVADALGYAVFTNFGLKLFFTGGGSGEGVVVDRVGNREVFMKMVEVQAGLGFGIKRVKRVFVFTNPESLRGFIESGWDFGGQGTVAISNGTDGNAFQGALSASPGVWIYQLTRRGLALELAAKGTKYYKDDALN